MYQHCQVKEQVLIIKSFLQVLPYEKSFIVNDLEKYTAAAT